MIKTRLRPAETELGASGYKVQYKTFLLWHDYPKDFNANVYLKEDAIAMAKELEYILNGNWKKED